MTQQDEYLIRDRIMLANGDVVAHAGDHFRMHWCPVGTVADSRKGGSDSWSED